MLLLSAVAPTPTQGRGGDDASSDSAVSMGGSQSAGSPDMVNMLVQLQQNNRLFLNFSVTKISKN